MGYIIVDGKEVKTLRLEERYSAVLKGAKDCSSDLEIFLKSSEMDFSLSSLI